MIAILFAAVQLVVALVIDRLFIDKTIVYVFEKLYLLATAKKLAAIASLIFTNCYLLNTYCFAYVDSVVIYTIDAIDC